MALNGSLLLQFSLNRLTDGEDYSALYCQSFSFLSVVNVCLHCTGSHAHISHDRIKYIIAWAVVPLTGSVKGQIKEERRSRKKSNGMDSESSSPTSLSTAVEFMEYLERSQMTQERLPVGL